MGAVAKKWNDIEITDKRRCPSWKKRLWFSKTKKNTKPEKIKENRMSTVFGGEENIDRILIKS